MQLIRLTPSNESVKILPDSSIDRGIYASLRRRKIWEVSSSENMEIDCKQILDEKAILCPDRFYLIETLERISIATDVFGLLSTNSMIARGGIDCLNSSSFISPGFGVDNPAPLVLEIKVHIQRKVPDVSDVLAKAVFFELNDSFPAPLDNPLNRFPFKASEV